MVVQIPILKQTIVNNELVSEESVSAFEIDTSVYAEERWEQNFPNLAAHESLFDYIERVRENSISDRVSVTCMLKAIYCFIESKDISSYKEFAQMFNLATSDYTSRLINTLKSAFNIIINSSSVKN